MWFGIIISTVLGIHGYTRRKLTFFGSLCACTVGIITSLCSGPFLLLLLVFYFTGTFLTKYKATVKHKMDYDASIQSTRSVSQVLACSFGGIVMAMCHFFTDENVFQLNSGNVFLIGYLAHYAACAGDTWASELGMLSKSSPVLITNWWKTVPAGTNGGITVWGTVASGMGGAVIGLTFCIWQSFMQMEVQWSASLLLTMLAGLGGSALDSLLGNVAQGTWYDNDKKQVHLHATAGCTLVAGRALLSNELVNLISVNGTMVVCMALAWMFL